MCRKNRFCGFELIALGVGILIGSLITVRVLSACIGAAAVGMGIFLLCRK